jgi:hypothetical protein
MFRARRVSCQWYADLDAKVLEARYVEKALKEHRSGGHDDLRSFHVYPRLLDEEGSDFGWNQAGIAFKDQSERCVSILLHDLA